MEKITIITATYNCVDEIEDSIKSVIEQDYPNIEFVIIDGASTDGTVDIIKKYAEHVSYWVSEPDEGLYYAMNKGIEAATGDWIYIFNAGGKFPSSNTLSSIFATDHTDADAIYGYIYSKALQKIIRNPKPFYECKDLRHRRPGFSHQAVFIRSNWLKMYPFDTSFKCCADFNQLVTIYDLGAVFKYIDIHVSVSALPGFSENHRKLQRRETARINGVEDTFWFRRNELIISIKEFVKRCLCLSLHR